MENMDFISMRILRTLRNWRQALCWLRSFAHEHPPPDWLHNSLYEAGALVGSASGGCIERPTRMQSRR